MNKITAFFTNNQVINLAIFLNITAIILEEFGFTHIAILLVDSLTILFFLGEMIAQNRLFGLRGYWRDGWNRLDGVITLLSLPSLLGWVFPGFLSGFSFIITLRITRAFRVFRLAHIFPNFPSFFANFKKAIRDSRTIFVSFFIIILISSLACCAIYKSVAPEYFGNPAQAFYSIFRLFTIEGWYDIPDAMAQALPFWAVWPTKLLFCLIVLLLGIIGLSTLTSVFVDAMVSDNNDELLRDLGRVEKKLDTLLRARGIDPQEFDPQDEETKKETPE